jgi:hypothetical protein
MLALFVSEWKRWVEAGSARFRRMLIILLLPSIAVLAVGLYSGNGTLVISGLVSLMIYGSLNFLGAERTKRILTRLQKAGPIEFSVAVEKTEYYEVVKAKEREFRKPQTRIDFATKVRDNLDLYIHFYRLKAHRIEAGLIKLPNVTPPRTPPDSWPGEQQRWLDELPQDAKKLKDVNLDELKELYRLIGGYGKLKELFDASLSELLKEADTRPVINNAKVEDAIDALKEFRNQPANSDLILPPHYFAALAHLQIVIGSTEAAFATLYESHYAFPNTPASNYLLAWYLCDLSDDYYTALAYADRALKAVGTMNEAISDCYFGIRKACRGTEASPLRDYLVNQLKPYKDNLKRDLQVWLKEVRHSFENFAAYAIAATELVSREDDAIKYAKSAVESDPENGAYLDTLGLVRLNFGLINRNKEDVREAQKLFNRAAHYLNKKGGDFEQKVIRLHQTKASAMVRVAEDWD